MIAEVFLEKENVLEKQRQDIIKILLMWRKEGDLCCLNAFDQLNDLLFT